MDKLAERLRDDAARIDVEVSDELDRRIEASLHATVPDKPVARPQARPPLFWWASTITGIAAAIAVIAILNLQVEEQSEPATPIDIMATTPRIELNAEAAMLTAPLQEELDKLQSDLKKAEEKVRRDIGL
ncbi:MAG: hypothetical protein QNJ14_10655 [Woeseiaceae bacterium]|nr:hypothetical protein [Woeseiaceae bacterium]